MQGRPGRGDAGGTGFTFPEPTAGALAACLRRAGARYRDPVAWERFQRNAMRRDFGWGLSARRYLVRYGGLVPMGAADAATAPAAGAPAGVGVEHWPEAAD